MVEKTAINRHLGLTRLGLGRVESRQSDRGEGGGERREFLSLSLSLSLSLLKFPMLSYKRALCYQSSLSSLQKFPETLPKFPLRVTKVPLPLALPLSLSFSPHPHPPPLARFVDPQAGPDLAARIQDGDFSTNSGFFDHPTACVQAMLCHSSCSARWA